MKMLQHAIAALLAVPLVGNAEISLDSIQEGAAGAAQAVGEAVGKAADTVSETIDATKESLSDEATPEATRAKLDAMAKATLKRLFAEQPKSRALFEQSSGYAVFDAREASFYVAAGYGRGVAVNKNTEARTYMKMATAGAGMGIGLGGFESQLVILFEDAADLAQFIAQGVDATAEAGAMAGEEKERLALRFNEGRAVFVLTNKGWKISAKLTGTRYWPDEELNAR